MPTQFTCPKCGQKLTLTVSKPGEWIDCPGCEASVQIPGAAPPPKPKPTQPAPPEPRPKAKPRPARAAAPPGDFDGPARSPWADKRVLAGAIAGGVAMLLIAAAGLVLALRPAKKEKEPEVVRKETPAARPVAARPTPAAQPAPRPAVAPLLTPAPKEPPPKPKVAPAPEPEPPEPPTPAEPPIDYSKLDQFGNPIDQNAGLAKQNEFGGQRILFWSAHSGAGDVFFSPKNPLWGALEQKGFTVRRQFGRFDSAWLKDADQFWVLSTAPAERLATMRASIPDLALVRKTLKDLLAMGGDGKGELLKELGAGFPKEWTADDIIEMSVADVGMLLSPSSHLTAKDYDAIVAFAKSGKGVCLLADNDPATTEASELARRLFGVGVAGNYQATKVAYVKQRKLAPAEVRKHRGDYEVDDHPLLTGVNFVYEGITISTVTGAGWEAKFDVALRASDGNPVLMVSKVPGLRVVLDCGFTRYYHGISDRVSFINMTAGTTRLAQNIAAYLAGKDAPKKK